jgi:hypothetical protein
MPQSPDRREDYQPEPQDPAVRTDRYSKDKKQAVAWIGGLLGTAALGWGIWATNEISALKSLSCAASERLTSIDMQARERDKALADIAVERAAAIQTQLTQIQLQLTEIQRGMRYGTRP